ncbi:MAG: TIM barrel protein [bacterium]|nr:TIM barrel protein [bacterium]
MMIFGAISNSWQRQLPTQTLATLVAEAQQRGARHIELRATCLGDCETGQGDDWRPLLPNLQALIDQFPGLSFNLAVPVPCLTEAVDPQGVLFQAALTGAICVGRQQAHLRIVDGGYFDHAWETPEDIPATALGLADLAHEAARQQVVLSIENVSQPLHSMAMLVKCAGDRLSPVEGDNLGLCLDLTNQLRAYPDSNPLSELAAISPSMIKMMHIKQTRELRPYPTVDTGDLDCLQMLKILQEMSYEGPLVFEIPPHEQALENLTSSFNFVRQ